MPRNKKQNHKFSKSASTGRVASVGKKSIDKETDPGEELVPGAFLIATIETMATFGEIGREVLSLYGIDKIDEEKFYPSKLRNEIHSVIHERFGETALFAFGFFHGERFWNAENSREFQSKIISPNIQKLQSTDIIDNFEALGAVFKQSITISDETQRKLNSNGSDRYRVESSRTTDSSFKIKIVGPVRILQESFYQGVVTHLLLKALGSFWEIKSWFVEDESADHGEWSEIVIGWEFKKRGTQILTEQVVLETKLELRENLLKVVLTESERQKSKVENLSNHIGKYIPPQIHSALLAGKYDTEITTRRKKLTIFFSDIKNFTSTSEELQPEDLTKYLNEYFSEMTGIALNFGATIDKYIGDAMMVFFGDPDSQGEKEDARSCVAMALKMQDRMRELQKKWLNQGFSNPFQVRMGINTGYCNVGNFGSAQRLTYTIIGGEVNVAQRLESNADENGILMSYETYAHAQDLVEVEERDSIKMKGINREIKIYSVIKEKVETPKKEPSEEDLRDVDLNRADDQQSTIEELKKDTDFLKKQLVRMQKDYNKKWSDMMSLIGDNVINSKKNK